MSDLVVTDLRYHGVRKSRNLEERLIARFPGGWRRLSALVQRRLEPRSRLRRLLLRRNVVSGWGAVSRRDFELMLVRYAPDVEVEFDEEFAALGLGGVHKGHAGFRQMLDALAEAWERWDLIGGAVLDLGDRILVLGRMRLPGTASGLQLEEEFAQLVTARDGLVVRDQAFLDWSRGLAAAGLDPREIDASQLVGGDRVVPP